jgi:glucosamine--fructose-6-phosphate aminotransferase (isomerizing)
MSKQDALGSLMAEEIREQPTVLARLLSRGAREVTVAAELIRARDPKFVLLVARGTSDHAALYAKYLIEIHLGLPCGLASPSTVGLFDAPIHHASDALVLAVSQSGHSPDLVAYMEAWRAAGATGVTVVNDPSSPLAAASEAVIDVRAGAEQAVAATKTFTTEMLALWMLVAAWRGDSLDAAAALPGLVSGLATSPAPIADIAHRYRFADRVILTGRGFAYPVAREGALKMMETSYLAAHAFSGADLLHGPIAMVDTSTPVLAVAPVGLGAQSMVDTMAQLRGRSIDVVSIGGGLADVASVTVDLPSLREDLAPIAAAIPLQWLAWQLAVDRGSNPDQPRALNKVTRTR